MSGRQSTDSWKLFLLWQHHHLRQPSSLGAYSNYSLKLINYIVSVCKEIMDIILPWKNFLNLISYFEFKLHLIFQRPQPPLLHSQVLSISSRHLLKQIMPHSHHHVLRAMTSSWSTMTCPRSTRKTQLRKLQDRRLHSTQSIIICRWKETTRVGPKPA